MEKYYNKNCPCKLQNEKSVLSYQLPRPFCMKPISKPNLRPICMKTEDFHRKILLSIPRYSNIKKLRISRIEKNKVFFQSL